MPFTQAILDGSSIVQELKDQAAAEGRAAGQAEGQAIEARRFLRRLLRKHFPELESLAEIDGISNIDALESLSESVFDADSAETVRAAILTSAQAN